MAVHLVVRLAFGRAACTSSWCLASPCTCCNITPENGEWTLLAKCAASQPIELVNEGYTVL